MARVKIIGIYLITSPTGRKYVGQSIDIDKRFWGYKAMNGCDGQTRLNRSFIKHGTDKHTFEIIIECDINDLNEFERKYQDHYDVCGKLGLNCVLTKSTDKKPFISKETRLKMSESGKRKVLTEQHLNNIKAAHRKRRGYKLRPRTDEEKQRQSEITISFGIFKGNKNPMYNSKRFGEKNPFFGKKHTEESKEKVRQSRLGKKPSEETLKKLSIRSSLGNNTSAKLVLDVESGIYYSCGKEAWLASNRQFVYSTFKSKLNGSNKYPLSFKYV